MSGIEQHVAAAASAIAMIDGYEMTKQGRAGSPLNIAAVASFVSGTAATILLVIATTPLGALGPRIDPPEFFALVMVGLSLLVALSGTSMVRPLISGVTGLLIAMIGIDRRVRPGQWFCVFQTARCD